VTDLPRAVVVRERSVSRAWLLPLLALGVVAVLVWLTWRERGVAIGIRFQDGHGLKPGDTVRYRGIVVGEVAAVRLEEGLHSLRVEAVLARSSDALAVAGSRFWIVRPEIGLARVRGLETVLGARHLGVAPGSGPPQREFVGLEDVPILDEPVAEGLEIIVEGPRLQGLGRGAPLTYRDTRIGTVLVVGLADDARAAEARVYVESPFVGLIRAETRFWNVSGIDVGLGLWRGLELDVQSLQTLALGGLALAVPDEPGPPVAAGHRFRLHERPEKEWLAWRPAIPIGPTPATLPRPLQVTLQWKEGRLWSSERSRAGWALLVAEGLLGPSDLLDLPASARSGSAQLLLPGMVVPVSAGSGRWSAGGASLLALPGPPPGLPPGAAAPWRRFRRPEAPEDAMAVVGDPARTPLPIGAGQLRVEGGHWAVAADLVVPALWHGAPVVGRRDGAVIGVLLVSPEGARLALWRPPS
jgi:hypothetical protein